jgi:general secretion pathway protein K
MSERGQKGVALAICLWFLAGMSLLVSGIVFQAKIDTRMTQLHLARATAASAGDGAMLLMLAEMVSRDPGASATNGTESGFFTLGRQEVSVVMVPTVGLVNLNGATAETLTELFSTQTQLSSAEAQTLANTMVEWRLQSGSASPDTSGGNFQSPEDILQVSGMTRTLWDAIRDTVVADGSASQGEPDIAVAPDSVKAIFGEGLPGGQSRDEVVGPKTGAGSTLAKSYRVDAVVSYGGRTWLRRKWVELSGSVSGGLPWNFTRVEAPRVLRVDQSSQ